MHKTVRDAQDPPKKQVPKKAGGKAEERAIAQPPEEVSDWDSEDERKQYGIDDKRARKAQKKKERLAKEKSTVDRVVAESAARAGTRTCQANAEEAVTLLVNAAKGSGAGLEHSSGSEPPTCRDSSCFLRSVPDAPPRDDRSRPTRACANEGTRASKDALKALLGARHGSFDTGTAGGGTASKAKQPQKGEKRSRQDSGEEPKAERSVRGKSDCA